MFDDFVGLGLKGLYGGSRLYDRLDFLALKTAKRQICRIIDNTIISKTSNKKIYQKAAILVALKISKNEFIEPQHLDC